MTKLKLLLLVLGLAAFLVSGACLLHLHASGEFGLWNEEHDLSLMAALGAAASQLDATPVLVLVLARILTLAVAGVHPVSAPLCHSDPRAPPLR